MVRQSFVLRRMRSAWLLVGCLMASVLVTAALFTFYSAALPATVTRELDSSAAMSVTISDQISGSPAGVVSLVTDVMRTAFGAEPCRQYQAFWSNDLALPGSQAAGNVPAIQAAALTGIAGNASLVSGSWPAAPRTGQPIPVALPASGPARARRGRADPALRRRRGRGQAPGGRRVPAAEPGRALLAAQPARHTGGPGERRLRHVRAGRVNAAAFWPDRPAGGRGAGGGDGR